MIVAYNENLKWIYCCRHLEYFYQCFDGYSVLHKTLKWRFHCRQSSMIWNR